jgi:polyhydroxyalkanoate synthesis regulator phasin/ribosomal protein S27AE
MVEAVETKVCGNGRCPHCGSCLVLDEGDGRLRCRMCGYVSEDSAFYEYIAGRPSTYSREESVSRKPSISGRLRRIAALRRGITWAGPGSNSKTNNQRGNSETMANYVERLAKALIETGDFSEDEAKVLAEALVKQYRTLRRGDGVRASLPKVGTVIEVLDSITSGRSNMEGGKYDMAIASALRRAFTTTGTYKPLIRRALRLLRIAEPSEELVELGAKYFEALYGYLKEAGKEAHRYVVSIAIMATAMAKVKSYNGPLTAVRLILIRSGFKNLIEELDLDKFINKIEKDAEKGETSTH